MHYKLVTPGNRFYQDWLAEGNTPEPVEEPNA